MYTVGSRHRGYIFSLFINVFFIFLELYLFPKLGQFFCDL
uniref:Uncharacterized protein n=1 Tax=Heterorhabditis bacteriophora TaxID=37862 RepID=A0A1I7W6S5_HETBA